MAELSSERPTPRKLNVTPQQSPVKAKSIPVKHGQKSRGMVNGVPATPAKSNDSINQQSTGTRKPKGTPAVNGAVSKDEAPSNKPAKLAKHPDNVPNGIVDENYGWIKVLSDNPKNTPKPPNKPSNTTMNGDMDKASSVASGPQTSSYVNGIVTQMNGVNGTSSEAGSPSLADSSDVAARKQPPKLKRKAPG